MMICKTDLPPYRSIFHIYGSDAASLSSRVWLELDAIPFVMRSRGHTLDERASTAVRQAVVTCVHTTDGWAC